MTTIQETGNGTPANRWRWLVWGGAAALLSIPLVAMQFTREVDWTGSDFLVFAAMLCVACGTYEIGTRMSGKTTYRAAVAVAILAGFLQVWVTLAVGIIGATSHPGNLMFAGVLLVAASGAVLARCRASGMVHAMLATAVAQAVIPAVVFVASWPSLYETTMITGVLVAMWLTSAALFWKSTR